MTPELFLISSAISIALIILSTILVTMFIVLNKTLTRLGHLLQDIERGISPMVSDVRDISLSLATVSNGLNGGMERVNRVTKALGHIGADLEDGRRAIKGRLEKLDQVTAPLLGILKVFRKN